MNYNRIAKYYDRMSRLVYGDRQHQVQCLLLDYLKAGDRVLWVGGGEGRLLLDMDQLGLNLHIDYVEASSVMVDLAQEKKVSSAILVDYFIEDIRYFTMNVESYDVVLTAFLFDHFSQQEADDLFSRLDSALKAGGIWLYADFIASRKSFYPLLTKMMLWFFRIAVGLKINHLPHVINRFEDNYELKKKKMVFKEYIVSVIYKKKSPTQG